MPRPRFAILTIMFGTFRSLTTAIRAQKMTPALGLAIFIFMLSIVFSFLTFAPILSPFIYPLF